MNVLIRGYRRIKKALRSSDLDFEFLWETVKVKPTRCVNGANKFNESEMKTRKNFDGVCIIMHGRTSKNERIMVTFAVPNYVLREVGGRYRDEEFTLIFNCLGFFLTNGVVYDVSMNDIGKDLLEGL